ncbi:hypothetical protein HK107_03615 [Parvularcula sp. ZS-1/3]|uniref:PEP-CTERM sorting domain-containing protein n=1 Tax=Parvularcula mediterranea TaxID=2732508 RepID=A0A7Y3RK17_9PROT|nr:hypothetical protein [Parvularcula mediterranea]NNU15415.1 hypothetical protein [Parvularcula mediterranea]
MKKLLLTTAALTLASAGLSAANAATVLNGQTTIRITANEDLGTRTDPLGETNEFSEVASQPVYTIMIDGDEIELSGEDVSGTLTHGGNGGGDGIAITLGDSTVNLTNFTIDYDANEIFADVSGTNLIGTVDGLSVFEFDFPDELVGDPEDAFDALDDLNLDFTFTDANLATIAAALGVEEVSGEFVIGNFATNPTAVPVPGAALLFAPVAAGLWMRRRQNAA